MTDIVERLRKYPKPERCNNIFRKTSENAHEAAAEIERLRAALRPFAKAAACYDDGVRGSNMPRTGVWCGWKMGKGVEAELTVEDLRDARAALAPPAGETNE